MFHSLSTITVTFFREGFAHNLVDILIVIATSSEHTVSPLA